MSAPQYPAELPGPLVGTFQESSVDPWISDRGEVGAPRRRKRFTRALRAFQFGLRLTGVQKAVLLGFYDNTLDDGVLAFEWEHPDDGATYLVRFASRPSPQHLSAEFWDIDVTLEEI